ncbi:WDGH domain-containing protein [Streptomyces tsukubensis]|uniref:WDGH domain-containing protein n=1 Tax=Streptomyces tsukubensis TaxID=83656 RepID=UPI00344CB4F8
MRTVRAERERDNAYRERARLVAHLAALHPSHVGYGDPDAPIWAVVTIETPAGQMSWHIAPRDVPLFAHVRPTSDSDRPWDGHSTEEKYLRLEALIGRASEEIDCRRCGAEPEN